MTSRDETHITRTSPTRVVKGLLFIIIPVIAMAYLTTTMWHFTASFPPMVSVPKTPAESAQSTGGGGGGGSSAQPTVQPGTLEIPSGASTQGNPPYAPATLTVKKGDVITVTNKDTAPHTVTSGTGPDDPKNAKSFDSSIIMPGKTAKINTSTLEPGDYPFHCTVHPHMKGTLTVKA